MRLRREWKARAKMRAGTVFIILLPRYATAGLLVSLPCPYVVSIVDLDLRWDLQAVWWLWYGVRGRGRGRGRVFVVEPSSLYIDDLGVLSHTHNMRLSYV